jgi:hypothetical protein
MPNKIASAVFIGSGRWLCWIASRGDRSHPALARFLVADQCGWG